MVWHHPALSHAELSLCLSYCRLHAELQLSVLLTSQVYTGFDDQLFSISLSEITMSQVAEC